MLTSSEYPNLNLVYPKPRKAYTKVNREVISDLVLSFLAGLLATADLRRHGITISYPSTSHPFYTSSFM
ncbi:hypothetical protein [Winogradskyella rapida]|uniref:Uncharacterized protein n=1 Tax=Winogradskyella rapida TaxID=549701 RepID=A0ABW3KNQ6_9FLAO